jgi:hypothetical protein
MSARFAAALTMCQMAFGVRRAPHSFPNLPTRRKSAPVLTETGHLSQAGIGAARGAILTASCAAFRMVIHEEG